MLPYSLNKKCSDKDIIKLHKQYMKPFITVEQLATPLECSAESLRQRFKKLGLEIKRVNKAEVISKQNLKLLIKTFKSGVSVSKLSLEFSLSAPTINKLLKQNGCEPRRLLSLNKETILKIYKRYTKGESLRSLGIEFSRSDTALKNSFTRHNLPQFCISKGKVNRNKLIRKQSGISEEKYTEYKTYHKLARALTKQVKRNYMRYIKNSKNYNSSNHIDHRLSIKEGFFKYKNPVPLYLLCHPYNLKVKDPIKNIRKGAKSSISITRLKTKVSEYPKEILAYLKSYA
jgi:lambda repressor-like predicted transcriptional regulator